MCYYISQKVSGYQQIKLADMEAPVGEINHPHAHMHNGFSYKPAVSVIPNEAEDNIRLVEMEWGFLPKYITSREQAEKMRRGFKDPVKGFQPPLTMLNAKSEELMQPRKVFRDAALKRRCLMLATGFFEWRHMPKFNKKTGEQLKTTSKYPYHINIKNRPYFFMAGIWQPFTDAATGETIATTAIVTTEANPLMRVIHNSKMRMPTILPDDMAKEWLLGDLSEEQITGLATYQIPYDEMTACTIQDNFRELPEPDEPYIYEDLPDFKLAIN
ncbi:hypothetical protein A0256_09960 [Mucilaginibacter sp. PAMC 26640]|nr:hypothetical protein A0256_09960 [Mucilaginibacter sp. PAMC 26640]